MSLGPYHYRLVDVLYEYGVTVLVEKYIVVAETPQGYWLSHQYNPTWLSVKELRKRKFLKWVSKTSTKRYAYPTMELAIISFKRRKQIQSSKLRSQLAQVDHILDNAEQLDSLRTSGDTKVVLGMPESLSHLVFDY